jgi:S1-C subfamily serine protease
VPTTVVCPSCSRSVAVPDRADAAAARCPNCGTTLRLGSRSSGATRVQWENAQPQASAAPTLAPKATIPRGSTGALAPGRSLPPINARVALRVGLAVVSGSVAFVLANLLIRMVVSGANSRVASTNEVTSPAQAALNVIASLRVNGSEIASIPAPPAIAREKSRSARPEPAPPPSGRALTTAEIVERCEPSVALIQGKLSSGTGFLVRTNVVATNAHVIDDEFIQNLEVRFPSAADSLKGPIKAELLYEDAKRDLAFLQVQTDLPALEVASRYKYLKGEDVTAIGNPGLDGQTVLENAISRGVMSTKTTSDGQSYYQLGMAVNPGNSGGPVFDSHGRVIGVVTLKRMDKEAVTFCIPVEDLDAAIRKVDDQDAGTGERLASKHRTDLAFKMLTSAGATYAIGLDVQRAIFQQAPNLMGQQRTGDFKAFEDQFKKIDALVYTDLPNEAGRIQQDQKAPIDVRNRFVELAKSYVAMKSLFHRPGTNIAQYESRVNQLKAKHLELVESIQGVLRIEVPERILAAFQENNAEGAAVAMDDAALALPGRPDLRSRFSLTPPSSLRDRFGLKPRASIAPRGSTLKRGRR